MRRYALRDNPWKRIKDLLPGRPGHVGVTAKDNRLLVEAVLHRYRAGPLGARYLRAFWCATARARHDTGGRAGRTRERR
jgi:hypothetical protein